MIYFTSDLHFGHIKPFLFEPRGFQTIEDHDAAIISRWNSIVTPSDEVYILGDLMLNDNDHGLNCLRQLNGKLYIIFGNHDTVSRQELYSTIPGVTILGHSAPVTINGYRFYLSHYPTLTSNYTDGDSLRSKTINLCGHTHTKDKFVHWDNGIIYHCDLDAHDCAPVSIDKIIMDIKEKAGVYYDKNY